MVARVVFWCIGVMLKKIYVNMVLVGFSRRRSYGKAIYMYNDVQMRLTGCGYCVLYIEEHFISSGLIN